MKKSLFILIRHCLGSFQLHDATLITTNTNTNMKHNTITGGKAGFAEAIHEAFVSNASNPTIRYSQSRGFHVESGNHPPDHDVVLSVSAFYNSDGSRSIRATDYPEVRMDILDLLDA
jgi:hypothetical protein